MRRTCYILKFKLHFVDFCHAMCANKSFWILTWILLEAGLHFSLSVRKKQLSHLGSPQPAIVFDWVCNIHFNHIRLLLPWPGWMKIGNVFVCRWEFFFGLVGATLCPFLNERIRNWRAKGTILEGWRAEVLQWWSWRSTTGAVVLKRGSCLGDSQRRFRLQ